MCGEYTDIRLFVPPREALSAVFQKLVITGEVALEMFLCRFIIFTPLIIIFSADGRAPVINGAAAALADKLTAVVDYQKPTILILINLDVPMGNLPE